LTVKESSDMTIDDARLQSVHDDEEVRQFRTIMANELTAEADILSIVARMAALISCGLGVSALEWSERSLTPVLVEFRGETFMALVPSETLTGHRFYLVPSKLKDVARWKRVMLMACNELEPESCVTCLCPERLSREWFQKASGCVLL
jgi:hypothetical protein